MSVASNETTAAPRRRLLVLLPLVVFLALAGLFLFRLGAGDPSKLPSALIGRPVPDTPLPAVEGLVRNGNPVPGIAPAAKQEGRYAAALSVIANAAEVDASTSEEFANACASLLGRISDGAVRHDGSPELRAALEVAKREGPDSVVVVLLPDGGRGYLAKIFDDDWMASYGFLPGDEGSDATVGDVLRGKGGELPELVHTHPNETIREAIDILREYGVSQMPVVGAEPPVVIGEVAGAVTERELLTAVFEGHASLADPVSAHMGAKLPQIGAAEPVSAATEALEQADALLVVEGGKPAGVITRQDLLGHLSHRAKG